jgi:hypothetical protein
MSNWILLAALLQAAAPADWEVSGVVRDASGPVKGIYVSMLGEGTYVRGHRTDSQGRYVLRGSRPGTYSLRIEKPEDGSEPRSRTLTLLGGEKLNNMDIVIPRGAVIAGQVSDRNGRPVSGMVVLAYSRSLETGRLRLFEKGGALTDDRGRYRISHLPAGVYLVGAVPFIRRPLRPGARAPEPAGPLPPAYPPVTFSPSGRSHEAAATIEVRGGEERPGVDIAMQREDAYCVFFRPALAAPAAEGGVRVYAYVTEWLGTIGPTVAVDEVADGRDLKVCGLPEGEYRLGISAITKQSRPTKGLGLGLAAVTLGRRHADLGAVQVTGFQSLTGRVAVRGAKPEEPVPEGMQIALTLWNRSFAASENLRGTIRTDGSFDFGVYGDTYGFRIENLPRQHYVVRMDQGGRDVRVHGVHPAAGPVYVEIATGGPALAGRVLSAGNPPQPVSEATVFLLSARRDEVYIAQSDQSGTYAFASGLDPGEYKVAAFLDLHEAQRWDPHAGRKFLSHAATIKLGPNENKPLDLTAQPAP